MQFTPNFHPVDELTLIECQQRVKLKREVN